MTLRPQAKPLGDLTFIETQFPVAKMSVESYRERKSPTQTLTGLGKWWGRKPLVLCRAAILALLLPATDDPARDREVFLRLMTMDDDGMLRRKSKSIPAAELFRRLPPSERARCFERGTGEKTSLKKELTPEARDALQRSVFLSLSYDERLDYCDRPEQVDGPSPESWKVINEHLGTHLSTLSGLVSELGHRRFGQVPRVGDAFCGGGSIPFEAARLGCESYGSDLNPAAALLTWASLNIIGRGPDVVAEVEQAQREVFETVLKQVQEWDIELREPDPITRRRWQAEVYLYCLEATCPECGWRVPLAPSWLIAEKTSVIARLVPVPAHRRFDFEVVEGASNRDSKAAAHGTVSDSALVCPNQHCRASTPIRAVRGDGRGTFGDTNSLLRGWVNHDVIFRDDDIFHERLYCIRWIDRWMDKNSKPRSKRYYLAPTSRDLGRERRVLVLLTERFDQWQKRGFIPRRRIETGYNTAQPIRERGWTHWHHLFTPRQLLLHGAFLEIASRHVPRAQHAACVACLLAAGYAANWNSRLSGWIPNLGRSGGIGSSAQTFYNQALNTLYNYAARATPLMRDTLVSDLSYAACETSAIAIPTDARAITDVCHLWITDPPYADAINYEEISEFFLGWYDSHIRDLFPNWYSDSKRALAVKGADDDFRRAMVDCYRRLVEHMPDNGLQAVMFTHQDAAVWADLALILWAAGLRVTAAWCVATETPASHRGGNYVQGTVLLILRKQTSPEPAFLDEIYQEVEVEVRRQLDSMRDLDDARDPNFGDTDYQLAAYAAALRVLTSKKIEDIDVAHELGKERKRGEVSPVEKLIQDAVRIACDHLMPKGIEMHVWKALSGPERLYLKGLEVESHGERRHGVYQELARGYGVEEYVPLLQNTKANEVRLKTPTEFGRKEMEGGGFAGTLVRHALFAIAKTAETESANQGLRWLIMERPDYAGDRQRLLALFDYFATLASDAALSHWKKDAQAAALLAGSMRSRQDHV